MTVAAAWVLERKNQEENPVAEEHACVAEKDDGKEERRTSGSDDRDPGRITSARARTIAPDENKFLRGTQFSARSPALETVFDEMRVGEQEVRVMTNWRVVKMVRRRAELAKSEESTRVKREAKPRQSAETASRASVLSARAFMERVLPEAFFSMKEAEKG